MKRSNKVQYLDIDDEEDVLRDGESIRVPMMLMDADQRDVHDHFSKQTVNDQQQFVRDDLAAMASMSGHRPGYVQDALTSRQNVNDALSVALRRSIKRVLKPRRRPRPFDVGTGKK